MDIVEPANTLSSMYQPMISMYHLQHSLMTDAERVNRILCSR